MRGACAYSATRPVAHPRDSSAGSCQSPWTRVATRACRGRRHSPSGPGHSVQPGDGDPMEGITLARHYPSPESPASKPSPENKSSPAPGPHPASGTPPGPRPPRASGTSPGPQPPPAAEPRDDPDLPGHRAGSRRSGHRQRGYLQPGHELARSGRSAHDRARGNGSAPEAASRGAFRQARPEAPARVRGASGSRASAGRTPRGRSPPPSSSSPPPLTQQLASHHPRRGRQEERLAAGERSAAACRPERPSGLHAADGIP